MLPLEQLKYKWQQDAFDNARRADNSHVGYSFDHNDRGRAPPRPPTHQGSTEDRRRTRR